GSTGGSPLAPADPLIPWWRTRREVNYANVNVTNVKYVNKTYVTVVNNNTFVSGDMVQNHRVRDETIIRRVNTEPIVSRGLPVPTRESLRVSVRSTTVARPPTTA